MKSGIPESFFHDKKDSRTPDFSALNSTKVSSCLAHVEWEKLLG